MCAFYIGWQVPRLEMIGNLLLLSYVTHLTKRPCLAIPISGNEDHQDGCIQEWELEIILVLIQWRRISNESGQLIPAFCSVFTPDDRGRAENQLLSQSLYLSNRDAMER